MSPTRDLAAELDSAIAHQNRWRTVMSLAYFFTAGSAIVLSGAATIVAGLQWATEAAWLAGGATVLFGLEKAMLFREKWLHHLGTATRLEALRLHLLYGELEQREASAQMAALLTDYALGLPVASRAEEASAREPAGDGS